MKCDIENKRMNKMATISPLRNIQFLTLFYILFAVIINPTRSLENCPEFCECSQIENNENHAKCSSLKGLLDGKNLQIHSIDLSGANLTKISHLEKLRYLNSIDVSHNQLSDFEHLGRRIKKLNLSHNKITSAKLTNIPQFIENLDLSFNEITYLPLELTIKLRKLKQIELIGNKINCTCETLEVRNWLQSIHVFTNFFIKCSYPFNVKDLPWLQVKQQDLCDEQKSIDNDNNNNNTDENDLMLSDQSIIKNDDKESVEELGKDFLPVKQKRAKKSWDWNFKNEEEEENDEEGSGGGGMPQMARLLHRNNENVNDTVDDEVDDGSGSGFGQAFIPDILIDPTDANSTDVMFDDKKNNNDDESATPLIAPIEETTEHNVFGPNLGVYKSGNEDNDDHGNDHGDDHDDDHGDEVSEETIFPVAAHAPVLVENINNSNDDNDNNKENPQNASIMVGSVGSEDENRGTYILLGVILFIVIALIIFVAMKRFKSGRQNRHNFDQENPKSTELCDMDKKNLGKPISKNGTGGGKYEHRPLIGEKTKEDYAKPINGNSNNRKIIDNEPSEQKTQIPLLNGTNNNNNNNNNELIPNTAKTPVPTPRANEQEKPPRSHSPRYGVYPPPKSPRSPQSSEAAASATTSNDDNNDEVFLPSSPRQGRYSPVYSPETGKVKIKLTETPKPKTPMLVTRSRSNAGEIILTKPELDK